MKTLPKNHTFSYLINNYTFEVYAPEYYQPIIPDYFKRPRMSNPPILNGKPVSIEEWNNSVDPSQAITDLDKFVPTPIFHEFEFNYGVSHFSMSYIIDAINNDVPIRFRDSEDIPLMIEILEGYNDEVKQYASTVTQIKVYLEYVTHARNVLYELKKWFEVSNYKGEMVKTISDILNEIYANRKNINYV